ncbi:MAG: WYL domain-containing protein [Bacteroidales bacterium]|jgi:predicted DNA-binding transcriptional regulator YafY|nr:WYL domain-containing protein [Bacteroidales bacterium]
MSKRLSTIRHRKIYQKLKNGYPATFAEIDDHLTYESSMLGEILNVSQRTLQRDIQEIRTIYGVTIKNREGRYYIEEDVESEINDRLFELLDMTDALKVSEHNKLHVFLQRRKTTSGSEHFYGILHAIKNRVQISFTYQKYYEDKPTQRIVAPLALKEFKNRWYLIAHKISDEKIRTYPLDRISDLDILSKKKIPKDIHFDIQQMMKHSFGIITPSNKKPEKIILSFHPFQGKYIKSLPLHETQEILIDSDKELRVSLNIYPEHDFKMEILSFGDTVKVLEPKKFAKEVKDTYSKALTQY